MEGKARLRLTCFCIVVDNKVGGEHPASVALSAIVPPAGRKKAPGVCVGAVRRVYAVPTPLLIKVVHGTSETLSVNIDTGRQARPGLLVLIKHVQRCSKSEPPLRRFNISNASCCLRHLLTLISLLNKQEKP